MTIYSTKERRQHRAYFQDLVFFPGPSVDNPLSNTEDFARRKDVLTKLITDGTPESARWFAAIEETYGEPLWSLYTDVGTGAQRGVLTPTIIIDMMGTSFGRKYPGCSGRLNQTKQPHAAALCQALIGILGAQWCDSWYMGAFHGFRVRCGADGTVEP